MITSQRLDILQVLQRYIQERELPQNYFQEKMRGPVDLYDYQWEAVLFVLDNKYNISFEDLEECFSPNEHIEVL